MRFRAHELVYPRDRYPGDTVIDFERLLAGFFCGLTLDCRRRRVRRRFMITLCGKNSESKFTTTASRAEHVCCSRISQLARGDHMNPLPVDRQAPITL